MEGRSEFVPSKGAKGQCRRVFKFHGDVLTNQFVLLSILGSCRICLVNLPTMNSNLFEAQVLNVKLKRSASKPIEIYAKKNDPTRFDP